MASTYLRNTLTLLYGVGIGQIISLASLPLLTHFYTAGQLGSYFIVYALGTIGAAVFSLKSNLTIVRALGDSKVHQALSISLLINIATHLLLMLGCLFIFLIFKDFTFFEDIGSKVFYCPIISFLIAIQLSFDSYYNQKQAYQKLKWLKIIRQAIMVALQLGLPLLFPSNFIFLVVAQIVGLGIVSLFNWVELKPSTYYQVKGHLLQYWNENKDILYHNTGIAAINSISVNLPYILISFFFGVSIAGYYGMVQRIIGFPLGLFGEALGVVFFQKASELHNNFQPIKPLVKKTLKMLAVYGLLPLLLFVACSRPFIPLLFGDEWVMLGQFLQIMAPMLFFSYVFSSVSNLISILKIQKKWILYEVIYMFLRSGVIIIGYLYYNNALVSLTGLVIVSTVVNIFYLYDFYRELNRYELSIKFELK